MPQSPQPPTDRERFVVARPLHCCIFICGSLLSLLMLLTACGGGQQGSSSLSIAVSGLPDGAKADISVIDGSGTSTHLTGEQLLRDLAAGSYQLNAREVTVASLVYRPDPASTVVEVDGTALNSVTISYSSSGDDASLPGGGAEGAPTEGAATEGAVAGSGSGVLESESLQGVLWEDRNGDGAFGMGDMVLPHTEVVLELANGDELLVETDGAGQYRFTGLTAGIAFTLRNGSTPGASPAGFRAQSTSDVDADNVRHYVWH